MSLIKYNDILIPKAKEFILWPGSLFTFDFKRYIFFHDFTKGGLITGVKNY